MITASNLRISLSGAAGIGKSTLAGTLARHFSLPLIDEGFDHIIDRSDLGNKTAKQWAEELVSILRAKTALEDQYEGFVSDRSAIDLLHFWGFYRLNSTLVPRSSQDFLNICVKRIRRYDFVVIPPWGSIPLEQLGEERAVVKRNMNPYTQMKHHASIMGFAHMWVDKRRIIEIPAAVTDLDQRIDYILKAISARQALLSKDAAPVNG